MVVSCAAYGCSQRFHKEADIRFHSFPLTNPDLLRNWLIAMRRENFSPKKHSRLCGKHFLSTDYHLASRELLTDSVKSVFNFPRHLQKTEKRRRVLKRIAVDDNACSSSQAIISSTSLKVEKKKIKLSPTKKELKEQLKKQKSKITTLNRKILRKEKKSKI